MFNILPLARDNIELFNLNDIAEIPAGIFSREENVISSGNSANSISEEESLIPSTETISSGDHPSEIAHDIDKKNRKYFLGVKEGLLGHRLVIIPNEDLSYVNIIKSWFEFGPLAQIEYEKSRVSGYLKQIEKS